MEIEDIQSVKAEFYMTAFQGANAEILSGETCLFLGCSEAVVSKPFYLNGCKLQAVGREENTLTYSSSFE